MEAFRAIVRALFLICLFHGFISGSRYIPRPWNDVCKRNITLASSAGRQRPAVLVQLQCYIPKSSTVQWRLNDLRAWTIDRGLNLQTMASNRTVLYDISVTCQFGADISLPWPMRVAGLVELHVTFCRLLDKYDNYMDATDSTIDNDMKVLEIRHSIWILGKTNKILESSGDALNLTSSFDCGQDSSLETVIKSNVSDDFTDYEFSVPNSSSASHKSVEAKAKVGNFGTDIFSSSHTLPEDRLINDTTKVVSDYTNLIKQESYNETTTIRYDETTLTEEDKPAEIDYLNLAKQILSTRTKCNYQKLKVLDESIAPVTPLHHFNFMVLGSEYPVLEFMNYSHIGLKELPDEFSEWRIYFPKLKRLDLSNNYISEFKIPNHPATPGVGDVVFNLRNNNITHIDMDMLKSWAAVDDFFVDISENPIHCDCDLTPLLSFLGDDTVFQGRLRAYRYVKYLECGSPDFLVGTQLHQLTTESLQCTVHKSNDTIVIALSVALCLLLILIVIVVKFKIEIRILLYTRLHVRLCCDTDIYRNNKTFDAFVSYSNEDSVWVFESLLKFLESPQSHETIHSANGKINIINDSGYGSRSFRLCIHQRDFIPGKTILDNIVDCIESSRHTIIVLSPSFLKSQWAMEELRQAYRQSLVEKSRHLIIILLEKVSKEEMDPLVRRCCKTFTYLDATDSLFKDRLVFSLTTKSKRTEGSDRSPPSKNRTAKLAYQPDLKGHSGQNMCNKLDLPYTNDNNAYAIINGSNSNSSNNYSINSSIHSNNYSNSNSHNIISNIYKYHHVNSRSSSSNSSGHHLNSSNISNSTSNNYYNSSHPPEPVRELSTGSTASTTVLTKY